MRNLFLPRQRYAAPIRSHARPLVSRLEPRRLLSEAVNVPLLDPGFDTLYAPGSTAVTATLSPGTETHGAGPGVSVVDAQSGNGATASFSDGTRGPAVDVPGWTGYADQPVGIAGPGNAYPGKTDNYAYVGPGYAIRQVLPGLTLQPKTTYVLTARVGTPVGSPLDAIQVALASTGLDVHAPATFDPGGDGFTTVTTYARTDVAATAAADVSVVLGAAPDATATLAFDDVTLTEMPTTPLTATVWAPDVLTAGSAAEAVTVTYADDTLIDLSSIAPANLTVTDPNGRPLAVTGVTTTLSGSANNGFANAVTATYAVAAPVGGWAAAPAGTYAVALRPSAVFDAVNTPAAATGATFTVATGAPTPTPIPTPTPAPGPTPTPTPLPTGTLSASLSAKLPPAIVSGSKAGLSASVTVTNPSTSAAAPAAGQVSGPVTVALYLSPDGSLDGAVRVAALTRKLNLKPGHGKATRLKAAALPSLADGTYTLLAAVTAPDGSVTAVAGPTLRVAAPFVATTVSAVHLLTPGRATAGQRISLSLTVTNEGNVAATGQPALTVSAAPAAGPQAGGSRVLATVPLTVRLSPGATRTYRVRFDLPPVVPTTYDLTASLAVGALDDFTPADGVATSADELVVA